MMKRRLNWLASIFVLGSALFSGMEVAGQGGSQDALDWNRTDQYVAPDFERFFPQGDEEDARLLDVALADKELAKNDPGALVEAVRKGLRSTKRHKTLVLSQLGNALIWNANPQNEKAIELMYHASGCENGDVKHYAMYFGATVVKNRSDNLMRMMMLNHASFGDSIQRRLHWSFKTYGDQLKTQGQLAALLDDWEALGEGPTIAVIDYYRRLVEEDPPGMERFASLGKWAVGFSSQNLTGLEPAGPQVLRENLGQHLDLASDNILEYVVRADGNKWVGVALLDGLKLRDLIIARINEEGSIDLEFEQRLSKKLLSYRRLSEFRKHLNEEDRSSFKPVLPTYTNPDPNAKYCWSLENEYVAPDFEKYFPIDQQAGKELDELIKSGDLHTLTDRETLRIFRNGLRTSKTRHNRLFSFISSGLGWPRDPAITELLYQASALNAPKDFQYNAIYFGLGNWWDKSDNVLKLFSEIVAQPADQNYVRNCYGRITWSMRNRPQEIEKFCEYLEEKLENHKDLDDATVAQIHQTYEEVAKDAPASFDDYKHRGLFAVLWFSDKVNSVAEADEFRKQFANNDNIKDAIRWETMERDGELFQVSIVRGIETRDWLLGQLELVGDCNVGALISWPEKWDAEQLPEISDFERAWMKR